LKLIYQGLIFFNKLLGEIMITKIAIENFKGIKDRVVIDLKPITLLFGPNSAGKSTIVQVLHYAREIFCRENYDPKETELGGHMDLGGFKNLVHRHNIDASIVIRFDMDALDAAPLRWPIFEEFDGSSYDYCEALLSNIYEQENAFVEITIKWDKSLDRPLVTEYNVGLNNEMIARSSLTGVNDADYTSEYSIELTDKINQYVGEDIDELKVGIQLHGSAIPEFEKLVSMTIDFDIESFDDEQKEKEIKQRIKRILSTLINGPGYMVTKELSSMRYIGPIRDVPPRNFSPVKFPDESRWANGLAAWDILYEQDEAFFNKVNDWLENKLDTEHQIHLKEYRELDNDSNLMLTVLREGFLDDPEDFKGQILELDTLKRIYLSNALGVEVMPSDIGVGISQLLPVIVGVLSKDDGSFLAIEQPELHLHPAIQVNLADLFIEKIGQWPQNKCRYIIETHSEHFMLRFLRRIREKEKAQDPSFVLDRNDLNVVIIKEAGEKAENGKINTRMIPYSIPIDEKGQFEVNWPDGFFEERYDEYFS